MRWFACPGCFGTHEGQQAAWQKARSQLAGLKAELLRAEAAERVGAQLAAELAALAVATGGEIEAT